MDGDIRNKVKKLLDSPALRVKATPVDDNPSPLRGQHKVQEPNDNLKEVVMEQKPSPLRGQHKVQLTVAAINKIFKELYDTIHDIHNKIPKKDLIKAAAQEIVEMFNNTKLRKNYKLPYKALLISNASDKQSKKAMKYDPFRANIVIKKVLPNLTPEHSQALRSVMKDIPNMPFANLFSKEEPNKEIPMVARETPQDAKGGADTVVVDDTPKTKLKQIQEIVKENPGKAPTMIPAKQPKEESKEEADKEPKPPINTSPVIIDYDKFIHEYSTKDELRLNLTVNLVSLLQESIENGVRPILVLYNGKSYNIPPNIVEPIVKKYIVESATPQPTTAVKLMVNSVDGKANLPENPIFSTYTIAPPRPASTGPKLKIEPQQYIHRVYKI